MISNDYEVLCSFITLQINSLFVVFKISSDPAGEDEVDGETTEKVSQYLSSAGAHYT